MKPRPEYFDRIRQRVNLPLLRSKKVVVVGVGSAGSKIVRELANNGVGQLLLIDGKHLVDSHLPRHELTARYVGMNKAVGMARYLKLTVPGLEVGAVALDVDGAMPDKELDAYLEDAALIVVSTDNRTAQRRVARRALALDIPAILPALYETGGGEIFVQPRPGLACFFCWDGFRSELGDLRAVSAFGHEAWAVLQHTLRLCHEVLDPDWPHPRLMIPDNEWEPPRQSFIQHPGAELVAMAVSREANCPSCTVGPARAEDRVAAPIPPRRSPSTPAQTRTGILAFEPRNHTGIYRMLAILIALLGFGVWAFALRSRSHMPQVVVQHIKRLHFNCVEPALCDQVRTGSYLPLFIDGLDTYLFGYLATHGYTDAWSGTLYFRGGGDVTRIEEVSTLDTFQRMSNYIYVSPKGDSGLMLLTRGAGLFVHASPGNTFRVKWLLWDKQGRLVKVLRFAAPVARCDEVCRLIEDQSPVAGSERARHYPPEYYSEPRTLFPGDP